MANAPAVEIGKDTRMSLVMITAISSTLIIISVQIACLAIFHAHFKAHSHEVGWFDASCRRIAAWLVSDKTDMLPEMIGIGMLTLSAIVLLFAALLATHG